MSHKLRLFLILIVILFAGTVTTLAQQSAPCAGFNSMLRVGQQGHVTPGSANNLRQNPGTNQTRVGQIPGNEIFMVIGGPVCADNVTWWQVNYKGAVGWTGEGTGNQRWLDTNVSTSTTPRTPVNGLRGTSAQTLNVLTMCGLFDEPSSFPFGRVIVDNEPQRLGNGGSAIYSIGDDRYFNDDPDLCINADSAGSAFAMSPQGATITPMIEGDPNGGVRKVRLPLWAYSQPGVWQLGVSGFSIFIDVQPAAQPVFVRYQSEILLGGFQPNERVVIVSGPSEREFFTVTFGDVSGVEVVTDANGFYVGAVPTDQDLAGAISSSGMLALGPRFTDLTAQSGDFEMARSSLYDAFFGIDPTPVVSSGTGAWSGPAQVGTVWQYFTNIFSAGGSSVYGILEDGRLLWYYHYGSGDGTFNWAGSIDVSNGLNWATPLTVFGANFGIIYAVSPEGDLWWYRHDGFSDGSSNWVGPNIVGFGGWDAFRKVFAGEDGAIYALRWDGTLLWYRHPSYYEGGADVYGGSEVAYGWGDFIDVFPGHGGVIYAITSDGRLLRYVHYGYADGSINWSDAQEIGTGWNGFLRVFAGDGNVIYAVQQDGTLLWYRYDGG